MTRKATSERSVLEEVIETSHDIGQSTKDLYSYCVRDFLAFAGATPDCWRLRMVEAWLHGLLQRELSPMSVRMYRKAIRYASRRYAALEERPELDFAHLASRIKGRKSAPRDPLSYEEADLMLRTCAGGTPKDIRDWALMVVALRTGLRRNGLRLLDFSSIAGGKITAINKGGEFITFEGDAAVLSALETWLTVLRQAGINEGAIFRKIKSGKIGERMSAFEIWDVFRHRARAAGVRDGHVFPHLARHSTVTWLREEGKTAMQIRSLTGQSERTIEDIYTHYRSKGAVSDALPPLFSPFERKS